MKKNINIPVLDNDKTIDLSYIDIFTKGIIIVYRGNKVDGVIMYDSDHNIWSYCQTINCMIPSDTSDSLIGLISDLMRTDITYNFDLIEY